MKKIFLVVATLATIVSADFSRSLEGVVTDSVTGLKWQDKYENDTIVTKKWEDAILYCEGLDLDGTTWRLPNINELYLLADRSVEPAPMIDSIFQQKDSTIYWSSTTYQTDKEQAWSVSFATGDSDYSNAKTVVKSVRCVRD